MAYVGSLYPYVYDVVDALGAPTNASTITLTITAPDQTVSSVTPANPSTGHYTFSVPLSQEGVYQLDTVTTSPTTADGGIVNARKYRSILSLREAKDHLNISSTNTLSDEEVRSMSEAATRIIEAYIGPCVPRTVVDRVHVPYQVLRRGYGERNGAMTLSQFPVISITSIVNIDPLITFVPTDIDLDKSSGIVRSLSSYFQCGDYTVTYIAGRTILQAEHIQAAKEMLWHLWTSQRGQLSDTQFPTITDAAQFENSANGAGLGFTPAMPARVRELLKPSRVPGFA